MGGVGPGFEEKCGGQTHCPETNCCKLLPSIWERRYSQAKVKKNQPRMGVTDTDLKPDRRDMDGNAIRLGRPRVVADPAQLKSWYAEGYIEAPSDPHLEHCVRSGYCTPTGVLAGDEFKHLRNPETGQIALALVHLWEIDSEAMRKIRWDQADSPPSSSDDDSSDEDWG